MGRLGRFFADSDRRQSLWLTSGLLIVALVTVVFSVLIVQVQAAANAYGGGESIWSRAQTNTTLNLLIYSETGEERFYDEAMDWLTVNQGDKRAREIIEQPGRMSSADWDEAREGLIQGQNHPDDVTRMIWLFRVFRDAPYFRDAIAVWRATDRYIERLEQLAHEMAIYHSSEAQGVEPGLRVEDRRDWQTELVLANRELTELAEEFRDAMGRGSRVMATGLTIVSIVLLLAMGGLAVYLSRRLTLALTRSRRRYRSMIEQTNAGVARVERGGQLLEVNDALCSILGLSAKALLGSRYRQLVHPEDWRDSKSQWLAFYRGDLRQLNLEQRFRRGNGQYVWLRINVALLDTEEGNDEFVVVMEDVTENRALHDRLDHQASHDELTGLKNRRALRERIQSLIDGAGDVQTEHALCFIDLDQFKVVNDTVGHEAGDHLLIQVTQKLRQCLRANDFIARLGGDEFAVIFEDCNFESAHYLAEKLRRALEGYPFRWDEHEFRISCSIGVTPIDGECLTGDDVLRRADMACYLAKEGGRNEVQSVRADDETISRRQMELSWVGKIRSAIDEQRLWLDVQPFENVNAPDRFRYEVLLRARDEQGNAIQPGTFIPAMERFGMIAKVDCWVIEEVCRILSQHPRHLAQLEACHINLSGRTFDDPTVADWIVDTVHRYAIPPERLCFEITETAAVRNFLDVNRFIHRVREIGCTFALDDFGSGLSSFGYLRALPVEQLKIDGVFVQTMARDETDRAMVEAITRIGKTLKMSIIAEFVEDARAAQLLREMGVDYLQGYYVARPESFERFVDRD